MQTAEGKLHFRIITTIRRPARVGTNGPTEQDIVSVADSLDAAIRQFRSSLGCYEPETTVVSRVGTVQPWIRRRYAVVIPQVGGHTNGPFAPGHFPYGGRVAWMGDSDIDRDAFVAGLPEADSRRAVLCEGGLPAWHYGGGPIWDVDAPKPIPPWDLQF